MKRTLSLIGIALLLLALCTACGNKTEADAPGWETQTLTTGRVSFALPKTWKEFDDPTAQAHLFAPADADMDAGGSVVSLAAVENQDKAYSLEVFLGALPTQFEKQINDFYSGAEDFTYSQMSAPCGEVAIASYTLRGEDFTMKQTQYYPLIDYLNVVVTVTDFGDGVEPDVDEVGRYIVNTLRVN